MKTAVSIPDEIFARAESLARKMKLSRSSLFSRALDEYLARHAGDDLTERMNAALAEIDSSDVDAFTREASHAALARCEW